MSFGDEHLPEEEVCLLGEARRPPRRPAPDAAATAGGGRGRRSGRRRRVGDSGEAAHSTALAEEADPREVLARERDEYLLALQRTQADFENYRKRIARLQEEQAARAVGRHRLQAAAGARHARPGRGPPERDARGERGRQGAARLAGHAARHPLQGGARARRPGRRRLRPLRARRRRTVRGASPATAASRSSSEVLRSGYRWKGQVLRAAMVRVAGVN